MLLELRLSLAVFVILWLSFHQCRAVDNSVLPQRLDGGNSEILGPNQLMECETLSFSLSPETSNNLRGDTSYYVLAFEPGGNAMMSFVGYEPSSLRWTVKRPAGTRLFIAPLDLFGTSDQGVPDVYTVNIPGSKECLTKLESPGTLEATELKKILPVIGCLVLYGPWEMSFFGGKLPSSVSIALALESRSVYDHSVPSAERIFPYTRSGEGHSGKAMGILRISVCVDPMPCSIVIVSDANGIFGTMSSIINFADARDTPSARTAEAFSICRRPPPRDMPFRLCELPHPTTSMLRRSLSDHPDMQLSRNTATINSSYGNTIAVAVCVSLGGTGIVAMAIYVIMMLRRRQKILDAQDILPRPFEITVPAATATGASMITRDLTSTPMLNISPPRVYSQNRGRGKHEAREGETSARNRPQRAGSASIPTTTTPSQSQPSSSRNTRMQSHPSDTSLRSNGAGPSSYRAPPRSRTHPAHSAHEGEGSALPGPRSRSRSRAHAGQSSSSLPTTTQPQRAAGTPVNRSASVQERRSAKHALWLSRSASELYRATSSVPRYRVPEYGSHDQSVEHAHRYDDGHGLYVDTHARPTNHLRQWHSASPVVDVHHVCSDPEEGMGTAIVFQHQDAGVMQELPPPYHKLIKSGVEV